MKIYGLKDFYFTSFSLRLEGKLDVDLVLVSINDSNYIGFV